MNKKVPFILLALGSLVLTACETNIKQEKFVSILDATEANVTMESDNLNNVHMQNKLGVNKIDYKEGEFYINTTNALALIIPIITELYTWREGDSEANYKYYHAEKHTITSNTKWAEITKEQFDVYMATGRGEVYAKLNQGITSCRNMLKPAEEQEQYKNIKNTFYKTAGGEYKMYSTMTYDYVDGEETKEKKRSTTFTIKNNLPVKFTTKDDGSESFYKFSYGNAKLRTMEKPAE